MILEVDHHAHSKSLGIDFEHTFRSKVSESGTFKLMPKTLALMAVQRHAAASRSTKPSRREQHGVTGGDPTTTLTKPSTLAHTPSFNASLGHAWLDGLGVGFGVGFGFGFGLGVGQVPQDVTVEKKKRMLMERNRAIVTLMLLEAILSL